VGRDLYYGLKARLFDDTVKVEDGGEVSDLWVGGDLRTPGGQGLANSTFSHVGGLPDLFMELT
jgi:hypothetical protein